MIWPGNIQRNVSDIVRDLHDRVLLVQPILDLCPPDTVPEVVSDEEVVRSITELNTQFRNDLEKLRQLQEKYPVLRVKSEKKLESVNDIIKGYKHLTKRLNKIAKEFLDPAKFKNYVRRKNPKEVSFMLWYIHIKTIYRICSAMKKNTNSLRSNKSSKIKRWICKNMWTMVLWTFLSWRRRFSESRLW